MRFTCSIVIHQPRSIVVKYFEDPNYLKHYQENFIKKDLIQGTQGADNSKSKLYYKMGKGTMELTETILNNNLPESFHGQYHHKHMDNTMDSYFDEINDNTTKYTAEIHYTAFRGFMAKTMATLFPFIFKKQVQKWMNNFKSFVENN